MIDIHTHVLPGIDDGSHNMEETERLLTEEHRQGVDVVAATPHFYASQDSIHGFLEKRDRAYAQTMEHLSGRTDVPRLLRGAEVYYFPGMGSAEHLPELTLEGTNVLLLEMPFAQWTRSVYREVEQIIRVQHLTVLLAHLERFSDYQKDRSVWEDVLDLPVYVQLNTGSFSEWKKRRFDMRVLKSDLPTVLGSDCHNMSHRPPNLPAGREVIRKKLGSAVLDELDHTAERLLNLQHRPE